MFGNSGLALLLCCSAVLFARADRTQIKMLYNFYIYNRKGNCLYYREWSRPLNTLSDDADEERRLVFGMLFSLKEVVARLSPTGSDNLHVMKTNNFVMHHYQSLTGFVFLINTKSDVPDLYSHLQHIYSNIFIEFVAKNPLYHFNGEDPIDNPLFATKIEEYLMNLPSLR